MIGTLRLLGDRNSAVASMRLLTLALTCVVWKLLPLAVVPETGRWWRTGRRENSSVSVSSSSLSFSVVLATVLVLLLVLMLGTPVCWAWLLCSAVTADWMASSSRARDRGEARSDARGAVDASI